MNVNGSISKTGTSRRAMVQDHAKDVGMARLALRRDVSVRGSSNESLRRRMLSGETLRDIEWETHSC